MIMSVVGHETVVVLNGIIDVSLMLRVLLSQVEVHYSNLKSKSGYRHLLNMFLR